jgi:hypothetical protein
MARRTKDIKKKKIDVQNHLKELEQLEQEALKEEISVKEYISTKINELCEKDNIFCGIVLSPKDLATIVELAITSKEDIKISFQLYFNE